MKLPPLMLFIFMALFGRVCFADQIAVSQDKILMTSQGLFLNIDGNLTQAEAISYVGNGIYSATVSEQPYYGHCGRCGWPRDENGKCTNRNCNGYGPPDRD